MMKKKLFFGEKNFLRSSEWGNFLEKRVCFEAAEKKAETCSTTKEKTSEQKKTELKAELTEAINSKTAETEKALTEKEIQETLGKFKQKCGISLPENLNVSDAIATTEAVKTEAGELKNSDEKAVKTGATDNKIDASEVGEFVDALIPVETTAEKVENPSEKIAQAINVKTKDANADISKIIKGISGSEFFDLQPEQLQRIFLVKGKNGELEVNFYNNRKAFAALGIYNLFSNEAVGDTYIVKNGRIGKFGINQNPYPEYLKGKLGFIAADGVYLGIETGDKISAPKNDEKLAEEYKKELKELTEKNLAVNPNSKILKDLKVSDDEWKKTFKELEKDPKKLQKAIEEKESITKESSTVEFSGKDGKFEKALNFIARFESSGGENVLGDNGKSWGMYQFNTGGELGKFREFLREKGKNSEAQILENPQSLTKQSAKKLSDRLQSEQKEFKIILAKQILQKISKYIPSQLQSEAMNSEDFIALILDTNNQRPKSMFEGMQSARGYTGTDLKEYMEIVSTGIVAGMPSYGFDRKNRNDMILGNIEMTR